MCQRIQENQIIIREESNNIKNYYDKKMQSDDIHKLII